MCGNSNPKRSRKQIWIFYFYCEIELVDDELVLFGNGFEAFLIWDGFCYWIWKILVSEVSGPGSNPDKKRSFSIFFLLFLKFSFNIKL
jgi:hypothetical protein